MSIDAQGVVRAFVKAAESGHERAVEEVHNPTIIISRTMGAQGDVIARMVADRLGLEVYGSEILDSVAKQAKVDKKLLSSLNEFAERTSDAWLYATLFGKNVSRDDYLSHLVSTVRGLYRMGGVILGRGAFLILENKPVLRVRITGSVDVCARRVAEEDGIDLEIARRKVRESNRKRGKFIWDVFRRRLNDPTNFDLVINMDKVKDPAAAADMILAMAAAVDLPGPGRLSAATG